LRDTRQQHSTRGRGDAAALRDPSAIISPAGAVIAIFAANSSLLPMISYAPVTHHPVLTCAALPSVSNLFMTFA
jgi:hypothetical protein